MCACSCGRLVSGAGAQGRNARVAEEIGREGRGAVTASRWRDGAALTASVRADGEQRRGRFRHCAAPRRVACPALHHVARECAAMSAPPHARRACCRSSQVTSSPTKSWCACLARALAGRLLAASSTARPWWHRASPTTTTCLSAKTASFDQPPVVRHERKSKRTRTRTRTQTQTETQT